MDPLVLGPEEWDQIARALTGLLLFLGLAVNTGMAFLLGHAVIPSLEFTGEMPRELQVVRWVLYPVFGVSLVLTLYALIRALYLGVTVIQIMYPRLAI